MGFTEKNVHVGDFCTYQLQLDKHQIYGLKIKSGKPIKDFNVMFMSRRPNARKIITWWNIESIQEAMIPHYEQMLIKNTTNLDIVFIKNNTLIENTDFTLEFENISLDQYD